MKLTARLLWLAGAMICLIGALYIGCGGASLDYGQARNLEAVEPNFVNPEWYDAYANDPETAAKKYKDKVFQVDVRIAEFAEISGGIGIKGNTGESERFRVTCLFPQAASNRLQSFSTDDVVAVKGLFHHIDDQSNTLELWLTSCVLTRH